MQTNILNIRKEFWAVDQDEDKILNEKSKASFQRTQLAERQHCFNANHK